MTNTPSGLSSTFYPGTLPRLPPPTLLFPTLLFLRPFYSDPFIPEE